MADLPFGPSLGDCAAISPGEDGYRECEVILVSAGADRLGLMRTVRQLRPTLNLAAAKALVDNVPVGLGTCRSVASAMAHMEALTAVGAHAEVRMAPTIFPPGGLLGFGGRPDDGFLNAWFSRHLVAMAEPSLAEWASAQGVVEAYRFTCLPTWESPSACRIWTGEEGGETWRLAAKVGGGAGGYGEGPLRAQIETALQPSERELIRAALEVTDFWGERWPTVYRDEGGEVCVTMDGSQWILEGWRSGEYRVQTVTSPIGKSVFWAAAGLGITLATLVRDRLPELRVS